MTTQADIEELLPRVERVWSNPVARDGKFGNALRSVTLENIRGMSATVEFQWPVVAIGGVNGCGKTTVLQACSSAYVRHGTGRRHFTLGRWIGPALAGETPPVTDPGFVRYAFSDSTPGYDVPYKPDRKRWGYPRRGNPERDVQFFGVGHHAPRIERRDRTHQNRSRLNITGTDRLDERMTESISRVLGGAYSSAAFHTVGVSNAAWEDRVPLLERHGYSYTEPHMGAGEQKVVRLIQELETCPDRSLVVLEEPELTLHPDAQYGLAWYLMALALRKGHQVIIATHSRMIFEALPQEARVLLTRDERGVAVLHGVSHLDAARQMSASVRSNRDLAFVEDEVARKFLIELLRRFDRELLRCTTIVAIGNANDVQRMVDRLRGQGVRAVGVRDPDQGEQADVGLFSLPGSGCPEELLIHEGNVARAQSLVDGIQEAYERARVRGQGHSGSEYGKRVFAGLCSELEVEDEWLADRLTMAWMEGNEDDARELASKIRAGLETV